MILDSTSSSIELALGGAVAANQLAVTCSFVDMTSSATTGAASVSSSNNATAVTIVAAPSSGTQRKVTSISIYNADTASATVTVRRNDSGALRTLVKISVHVGYTLQFSDVTGWTMISDSGVVQVAGPIGPAGADGIAKTAGVNDQTGTSYTLVLGDAGKDVRCTNSSAITLTIPPNSSVAFPTGTVVLFSQGGAGAVSATAGAGVTLRAANGAATTAQYDARGLEKTDVDTWRVW